MKKLFLVMALGVLSLACSAQVEKVVLTPAKNTEVSSETVLDSVKKVLPHPISSTLNAIASSDTRPWNVYFTPASDEIEPMFYHVYLRGKAGRQTLIYDKDGNLVQVKQVLKNTEVPETIQKTLSKKYSGWRVLENQERHISANDKATTDYKVILKKGIIKKSVILEPDGDVKTALPVV